MSVPNDEKEKKTLLLSLLSRKKFFSGLILHCLFTISSILDKFPFDIVAENLFSIFICDFFDFFFFFL